MPHRTELADRNQRGSLPVRNGDKKCKKKKENAVAFYFFRVRILTMTVRIFISSAVRQWIAVKRRVIPFSIRRKATE